MASTFPAVLQVIEKRPGLAAKKDEGMQPMSNVLRMRFDSRGAYADFALAPEAPRYSAFCCGFYTSEDRALGVTLGEALFADDEEALWREALAWDKNGLNVALVPTELDPKELAELGAPDRVWIVTGSRDFPDALLDNVFVFDCPALDASREEAERMALSQLCKQDQHPLTFIDREDETNASYLQEVAQAPDERKGWGS
jgi:hypothetical protein